MDPLLCSSLTELPWNGILSNSSDLQWYQAHTLEHID